MATDFSFFERSLTEKRIYRVTRDRERDLLKDLATSGDVEVLEDSEEYTDLLVANLMDPGTPEGVKPIEERFGVTLPQDVRAFYRRWNGGILIYQAVYSILDVESIIAMALEFRQCHGVPAGMPWHVLRFCDIGSSDYFALRHKTDAEWEVILADHECHEMEFLVPEDPKIDARRVLAGSFLGWLRRLDESDGWPWGKQIMPPHRKPPCQRVW